MFFLRMKSKIIPPHTKKKSDDIKCTISAKTVNAPSAKLLNFFSTALKPSQMFTRNSTGTFGPLLFSFGYCEMHNNMICYAGHSTGHDIKFKPKADSTTNHCSHQFNLMFV